MTAIRLSGISYEYEDGILALDNLDMEIPEGQCVAILGPNGAGKSTLLKIMAGLLLPSKGKVLVSGKELGRKGTHPANEGVGIVFQDPDDQIFMPRVWDDIAFGPINLGLGKEGVERRVEKAMQVSGIEGFDDRVPHHLSYGEKKRVAMAGILAMEPKILLLDEPTANLDPESRAGIMKFIKNLGCTVVLATHDIEAAAAMADKIYVLDGKVLAHGGTRDILANRPLLEGAGLEMPVIARLFSELKVSGYPVDKVPLTVEEAVGWFACHDPNQRKG
jgi:cobalt/nickel transport system ATP-binding protein